MARTYLYVTLFSLFIVSCTKTKKEYYSNGILKKKITLINGKYEGEVNEYYKSGNLKERSIYEDNLPIDSTTYFHDNKENSIFQIVKLLNDTITKIKEYDTLGNLRFKGKLLYQEERIGKWTFYGQNYDSIVEYTRFKGNPYANQVWVQNKQNDILPYKSNFYSLLSKDTIQKNDYLKISILLSEPYFSDESEMKVLLPKKDFQFKKDFSNIDEIELDTIPSFKNFGVDPKNYPDNFPFNHATNPALQLNDIGLNKIRGIIVEFINDSKNESTERWLFFEKEVYVKDTL